MSIRTIRKYCVECMGDVREMVARCEVEDCALWPMRMGRGSRKSGTTPFKAIKTKCMDCSRGSRKDVVECVLTHCPLFPYREGKRPPSETQVEANVVHG